MNSKNAEESSFSKLRIVFHISLFKTVHSVSIMKHNVNRKTATWNIFLFKIEMQLTIQTEKQQDTAQTCIVRSCNEIEEA